MPQWTAAEYRDFDEVPRAMLCTSPLGTFYFLCRFDAGRGAYGEHYDVYRVRPLRESAVCASWFGLETGALERLPDLPVGEFPFDRGRRVFLDYGPIASRLRGGGAK